MVSQHLGQRALAILTAAINDETEVGAELFEEAVADDAVEVLSAMSLLAAILVHGAAKASHGTPATVLAELGQAVLGLPPDEETAPARDDPEEAGIAAFRRGRASALNLLTIWMSGDAIGTDAWLVPLDAASETADAPAIIEALVSMLSSALDILDSETSLSPEVMIQIFRDAGDDL